MSAEQAVKSRSKDWHRWEQKEDCSHCLILRENQVLEGVTDVRRRFEGVEVQDRVKYEDEDVDDDILEEEVSIVDIDSS